MTISELKRMNTISIYQAILEGLSTIASISDATGICQLTVGELANELVEREFLDMTKPRRNVRGRRIHYFKPSHKYYSVFIEVQSKSFVTIGISTSGSVIERFDYPLDYEGYSRREVLERFVIKRLKQSESYKYCMAIYLLGDDKDEFVVDKEIIKTTKEMLIATSLVDKNKLKLFDFNGTHIMSLYSHLHIPTVGKAELTQAIPFDEICTFQGDLYFDTFDALQKIAMINLESHI